MSQTAPTTKWLKLKCTHKPQVIWTFDSKIIVIKHSISTFLKSWFKLLILLFGVNVLLLIWSDLMLYYFTKLLMVEFFVLITFQHHTPSTVCSFHSTFVPNPMPQQLPVPAYSHSHGNFWSVKQSLGSDTFLVISLLYFFISTYERHHSLFLFFRLTSIKPVWNPPVPSMSRQTAWFCLFLRPNCIPLCTCTTILYPVICCWSLGVVSRFLLFYLGWNKYQRAFLRMYK